MNELLHELNKAAKIDLPLVHNASFNDRLWTPAGVPLGDDKFWMYQDNKAEISCQGVFFAVKINKFSLSHDRVQMFDNPKHLYLTKESYRPGVTGKLAVSCRMKSLISNGDPEDYRDGFGAFNVLDFDTGMVFDIICNGHKLWVIYERLFMPGSIDQNQTFTNVIPIERPVHRHELIECAVIYNQAENRARYFVDSDLVYETPSIPVKIETLQTGFGFITLHPIDEGKSVSCRGQGGMGLWGDFKVTSF